MADATYQPKVYRAQGGDELVVASGGKITVESGGEIDVESGGIVSQSAIAKAVDFTLTAANDGQTFIITAADKTVTLPATVLGLTFTFVVKTLGGSVGFSISPNASDKINALVDDKDLINEAATDAVGDTVTVLGDGDAGWLVTNIIGTWATE